MPAQPLSTDAQLWSVARVMALPGKMASMLAGEDDGTLMAVVHALDSRDADVQIWAGAYLGLGASRPRLSAAIVAQGAIPKLVRMLRHGGGGAIAAGKRYTAKRVLERLLEENRHVTMRSLHECGGMAVMEQQEGEAEQDDEAWEAAYESWCVRAGQRMDELRPRQAQLEAELASYIAQHQRRQQQGPAAARPSAERETAAAAGAPPARPPAKAPTKASAKAKAAAKPPKSEAQVAGQQAESAEAPRPPVKERRLGRSAAAAAAPAVEDQEARLPAKPAAKPARSQRARVRQPLEALPPPPQQRQDEQEAPQREQPPAVPAPPPERKRGKAAPQLVVPPEPPPAAAAPEGPEAALAALLAQCVGAGALRAGDAAKYRYHFRRTLSPADQELDLGAMQAYAEDGDLAAAAKIVRATLAAV